MGIIKNCLRAGDLGIAILQFGGELTRGMTTRDHFQDLKDVASDTYQESRKKGSGRVTAALKAAYESYQCDKAVTVFKWARAVSDLIEGDLEEALPRRLDQRDVYFERQQVVHVCQVDSPRPSNYGRSLDEIAQARPIK